MDILFVLKYFTEPNVPPKTKYPVSSTTVFQTIEVDVLIDDEIPENHPYVATTVNDRDQREKFEDIEAEVVVLSETYEKGALIGAENANKSNYDFIFSII